MKKTLCALAIGATVISPVAFADVSLYGRAHVSLDWLDGTQSVTTTTGTPPVTTTARNDYSELNVSSNSSRLGFKGDTKLNDDLTAFFQIEQEINFAQGNGSSWASRDTFVGLKGDFGSIRVGQFDSPFKVARGPADLFGDQVGDLRNLTRVGNARFDERPQNTIHYQTPAFSGLQGNLAYSPHENASAPADGRSDAISASVTYKNGPLNAALAYETWGKVHSRNANNEARDGIRLAAGYKVIPNLELVGFFQDVDHGNNALDAKVYGVGANLKVTDKTYVKGHYFTRDADQPNRDSDLITLGVEHRLASAFRVYANFATVSNDDLVALTPWQQARTTEVPNLANGERTQALSFGARYDF